MSLQDTPHLQQLNRHQLNILTYSVRHSGHNHELVSHGVDVVHLELADAVVEARVEQVHEVDQLGNVTLLLELSNGL